MRSLMAALMAVLALVAPAPAQEGEGCDIPSYLLLGDAELSRVAAGITGQRRLKISVIGTGSSMLAGPDGVATAYPSRLQAALRGRLPGVEVIVVPQVKPRLTTGEMAGALKKILAEEKPTLVIWQAGTVDAMRGVDPDAFKDSLEEGVDAVHNGGADVVLMNMQFSPRTESMIALNAYADNMRWVAQNRGIPLFDRLALMRHWSEAGTFDLYAATRDYSTARKVHDCLGRALAEMIVDAARLPTNQSKAPH
jgi:hypothetical protein